MVEKLSERTDSNTERICEIMYNKGLNMNQAVLQRRS